MNLTIKRRTMLLMGFMVTIVPAVLVAVMIYSYYLLGVEYFFDNKINLAIDQTVNIAKLYLKEHKDNIKIDAISVANNVERNKHIIFDNKEVMQFFIDQLANARGLAEIMIFKEGFVIARNTLGFALLFENIKSDILQKLDDDPNEVLLLEDTVENRVRVITKINGVSDEIYVLVGRYIDQSILANLNKTENFAKEYKLLSADLEVAKHKLEIIFIASFIILLMISILIARKFSLYITQPIEAMSLATLSLHDGDFTVRVKERKQDDEINSLTKAFNIMIQKISEQREQLFIANDLNTLRLKFIEIILAEIPVGVLAINSDSNLIISNNIASSLLKINADINEDPLNEVFPEIMESFNIVAKNKLEHHTSDIIIVRNNHNIHLSIKIGILQDIHGNIENFIITLNDITELIKNQKLAAWADVARRVAHEIKNPLTPIFLAAERLKKKYKDEIKSDPESFVRYIETIMSHVQSIEQMAVDFVDFAKIQAPHMERNNLIKIIEEALLLHKIANPKVKYEFHKDQMNSCYVKCDYGQIIRVLNNLLNNAVDAISAKYHLDLEHGIILIRLYKYDNNFIKVTIQDNGCGINQSIIDKISEPYVTTKSNGTGLGLAIVSKIIEEHAGKFLLNNVDNGALVSFSLPLTVDRIYEE